MDFLPIFLDLKAQPCLVVGGGDIAARKASLLLDADGAVTVVSPELSSQMAQYVKEGRVEHLETTFDIPHLEGMRVVIAATDDRAVNELVSKECQSRSIPVNVVDNPDLCSFIMPSIIDRSPVQIAVSTGGSSPVLARILRARLESTIPAAYGRLASMVNGFRDKVKARFDDVNSRRNFWEGVLQGDVAELVFAGKDEQAEKELELAVKNGDSSKVGEVYLIGGGPGDPDLLTFRALRLMQQADVIVHDRLISKEVLNLTRRDADRIYVGKERDQHTVPQDQINQLLVDLAKEGKRVCRLKGGDPFVFGRGGEEIETLSENGVNFQVVPGITAALGTSAYAGIPLTHRDYSQSVVFVTGHLKDGSTDLNWKGLAQPNQTIVFYMGLKGLPTICKKLMENGLPEDLPIALVQQATTPRQRVFTGTLSTITNDISGQEIKPPTLIIVGNVVKLHDRLNWFRSEMQIAKGEG
ncbi:MAG: siroheme synthase CysG [Chromatiales bacterium]|nr:siroheme synthase CysG [Chromatiales bacterium]